MSPAVTRRGFAALWLASIGVLARPKTPAAEPKLIANGLSG